MRMTLKEVCNHVGVTRRAVQGYEKAGLVNPTERNKYGHHLYDESAVERIKEIKKYQDYGFSIKEIKVLQDLPKVECLKKLKSQLILLQSEMQKLKSNIEELDQLIKIQTK